MMKYASNIGSRLPAIKQKKFKIFRIWPEKRETWLPWFLTSVQIFVANLQYKILNSEQESSFMIETRFITFVLGIWLIILFPLFASCFQKKIMLDMHNKEKGKTDSLRRTRILNKAVNKTVMTK